MSFRKTKKISIPTPQSLAGAALFYLERYAASEASLRRVLTNRVRRAALVYPSFAEDEGAKAALLSTIDQLVDKYKKMGALDDDALAASKAIRLRREGRSRRAIVQKLQAKGLSFERACTVLETQGEDVLSEEAEMDAARIFVRRRRLRQLCEADPERRHKALATLARAGFSLDVARKALGAEGDDFL